ncbi:MAG: hypothetical protein A2283_03815 [Lentisphaerae bacterium RIFOXYA12_FULL_48_11]|nr:MAG: hypothetical protein A2283_03815 [Lentisphaerae bacterium RIFOXYA12_FULL_48_11]
MGRFQRGIKDQSFIQALNDLRKNSDSSWSKMVEDRILFIAIRDEYIDVYYKGNSICKLSYNNGVIVEVHYKYLNLSRPQTENVYVKIKGGKYHEDIDLIKKASENYVDEEKSEVYSTILANSDNNVIDVEIAFPRADVLQKRKGIDTIDYLRLERGQNSNTDIRLVFYEVNLLINSEIKSRTTPKVLEQIDRCEEALHNHEADILTSYALVAKNLMKLGLIRNRDLIRRVADNPQSLSIDFKPRLIIPGYDQDQKDGEVWNAHRDKLREVLGDRLTIRG